MRITNRVLKQDFLNNLSNNLGNMQTIENQLTTGHEISKPSDDPFRATRTMELLTDIYSNDRYKKNIEESIGWLSTVDSALDQVGNVLITVKEKTIAGGDGAYGKGERDSLKQHLKELREQLLQIGNTAYDGRYIFGGDKTTYPPFSHDTDLMNGGNVVNDATGATIKTIKYDGSNLGLNREMSQGVVMDISIKGNEFSSVFGTLDEIIIELDKPDGRPESKLGVLEKEIDNILALRAKEGAQYKRLEDMNNKNDSETFNMTELLSKTYDVDVAKKYMEFKVMESVYQASLMMGPKILQPSMLDFMR